MHEMGLAMDLTEIIYEHLPKDIPCKVKKIRIRIGKLTAVIPETFKFCLEVITKDTIMEGAELEIEEVPLIVRCKECHTMVELLEPIFICPNCQGGKMDIISGRELYVDSIEVEEEERGIGYGDQGR